MLYYTNKYKTFLYLLFISLFFFINGLDQIMKEKHIHYDSKVWVSKIFFKERN